MYTSVEEYFRLCCSDLVPNLDKSGDFWPRVKDNSISNSELKKHARFWLSWRTDSAVYQAANALLEARRSGKLPDPG